MGFITNSGAVLMLQQLINAQQYYYLALVTGTAPGPATGGDELDEPDAEDYARVQLDSGDDIWMVQDGSLWLNIDIPFATAVNDWGQITGWALCTDPEEGDTVIAGQLDDSIEILSGDSVVIAAGGIYFSIITSTWVGESDV